MVFRRYAESWRGSDDRRGETRSSTALLRPVLPRLRSLHRVAFGRADRADATSFGGSCDLRVCPTHLGSVLRDRGSDESVGGKRADRSRRPGTRLLAGNASRGVAAARQAGLPAIRWVQADASALPFRDGVFDAVVCAYALYELKGSTRGNHASGGRAVCSRPDGRFLAMEHEAPTRASPASSSRCGWRSSVRRGPGHSWEVRSTNSVGYSRRLERRSSPRERARS